MSALSELKYVKKGCHFLMGVTTFLNPFIFAKYHTSFYYLNHDNHLVDLAQQDCDKSHIMTTMHDYLIIFNNFIKKFPCTNHGT